MELEFNKDIGPYTIRVIPRRLFRLNPDDRNETIELMKNINIDNGLKCLTLAYWEEGSDGFKFKFFVNRPFIIKDEYILAIWQTLKLAQSVMNEFLENEFE